MIAYDYIEKRHVEVGKRRWICVWYTETEEYLARDAGDDAEFDPYSDLEDNVRAFPSRGLAVAFARRLRDYWGAPIVRQEAFELDHPRPPCGSWEVVRGTEEEVVPEEVTP